MQVQTATGTTVTIMALPASPTPTNPDMILPYGEYDSTPSPPQDPYVPQAGSTDWSGDMQFSIGPPHAQTLTPTTPIIYGNGTMLSDIGEVTEAESTPGRSRLPGPAERRILKQRQKSHSPLRSSPTIGHAALLKRTKTGTHQRKISIESTSTVKSDGQAAEPFNDFDDGVSVDDSVFQGDDEGSVADSYSEEVIASETARLALAEGGGGRDEDRYSSAALSRRAEEILLNAKKRLNNMEGNLTRARSSLYHTPSNSMPSIHSSSPLTRATPSPPQNGQRIVPPLGVPPAKYRQLGTPVDTPNSSPGHSRVYSASSIQSMKRPAHFPIRASSAAARYAGKRTTDGSPDSLPKKYSPDREDFSTSRPGLSPSSSRASPLHGVKLEPLSETEAIPEFEVDPRSVQSSMEGGYISPSGEHRGLTRSASSMQMRDLRDQMSDLKGRLSVLRDRARDDTMKRRSLQSLRTPSPFTAAEQWYAAANGYGQGGLSADAGVAHPPWQDITSGQSSGSSEKLQQDTGVSAREVPDDASSVITSVYEDVSEGADESRGPLTSYEPQVHEEDSYNTAEEEEDKEDYEEDYIDELVNRDEADDYESDASLYHDTLVAPLSHEDREDAFDYQNFFLHSAMGTMSQQRNRRRGSVGSFSSEDSVETTRGPATTADQKDERQSLGHLRSESTDSVSTMATFATATEGLGSEAGDDDDHDNFAVQHVNAPEPRSETPLTSKRSTFGSPVKNGSLHDRQVAPEETSRPSSAIHDGDERNGTKSHRPPIVSFESTGTTRSFPLVNKPKSQQSIRPVSNSSNRDQEGSSRGDSMSPIEPSPVEMLAREDRILVERVVASVGECVLGLQDAGRASYESRVWRRRLDLARRVLEGQDVDIQ